VSTLPYGDRRAAAMPAAFTAAAAIGAGAAVLGHARVGIVPLAMVSLYAVAHRYGKGLLTWQTQVSALVLVVMFIPIRRYSLPGALPFQLEPYRLLVALIAALWIASLLIDRRVRMRRTMLDGPIVGALLALLLSIAPNTTSISEQGLTSYVLKTLTFYVSFVVVYYVITSVVRTWHDIDHTLVMLVGCGTIVAGFALFEARTGINVFSHLSRVMPILHDHAEDGYLVPRGGRLRALASAQHPIALGAMLVLLLPFVTYLASRGNSRLWYACGAILALGAIATVSRTAIMMLVVEAIVFLRLRPVETRRLWPLLLPLLVAVHLAVPGAAGALKDAFLPKGGIVAEQQGAANTRGSGRLADLSPSLAQASNGIVLGQGEGTRVVDGPNSNARILDDQWLGLLLDTGVLGVAMFFWLIRRSLLRTAAIARVDRSPKGLLLTAATASVAAFGIGMLTFDAFSFIQVTFVFFILLALSACVVLAPDLATPELTEKTG
jgi:hypothetical protein